MSDTNAPNDPDPADTVPTDNSTGQPVDPEHVVEQHPQPPNDA